MGQYGKFGVVVALGALLSPAEPALAGACHRVSVARACHAGCAVHRQRPAHDARAAASHVAGGALPRPPYWYEAPGPYPVGYDGSSATPTGYGVVYNVPPASNLTVKREPDYPREDRVVVLSGGVVSAAY